MLGGFLVGVYGRVRECVVWMVCIAKNLKKQNYEKDTTNFIRDCNWIHIL